MLGILCFPGCLNWLFIVAGALLNCACGFEFVLLACDALGYLYVGSVLLFWYEFID